MKQNFIKKTKAMTPSGLMEEAEVTEVEEQVTHDELVVWTVIDDLTALAEKNWGPKHMGYRDLLRLCVALLKGEEYSEVGEEDIALLESGLAEWRKEGDGTQEFKYMWTLPPIDFWEGAQKCTPKENLRVIAQMPEDPREEVARKTYVPGDTEMTPVYLCKASNNGTIYLFADDDVFRFLRQNLEPREV